MTDSTAQPDHTEIDAALGRIGEADDSDIDIGEAALLLAARNAAPENNENGEIIAGPWTAGDIAPYRAILTDIAATVARISAEYPTGLDGQIAALNRSILETHGFSGDTDTYDDLANANLMRVIDRRKGLPVALGILYLHAARAQGWQMAGLNFPGHFLVRLDDGAARTILDPFRGGRTCEPEHLRELLKMTSGLDAELTPDLYQPVTNRAVLIRLQNNIKSRHLQASRLAQAAHATESMLLIAPTEPALWYELAIMKSRLGNIHAGIAAAEKVRALSIDDTGRLHAEELIRKLRGKLN